MHYSQSLLTCVIVVIPTFDYDNVFKFYWIVLRQKRNEGQEVWGLFHCCCNIKFYFQKTGNRNGKVSKSKITWPFISAWGFRKTTALQKRGLLMDAARDTCYCLPLVTQLAKDETEKSFCPMWKSHGIDFFLPFFSTEGLSWSLFSLCVVQCFAKDNKKYHKCWR